VTAVTRCDALVLGGDLEGLVAALTIARTGRRVVVLCERPRPGGLHGSEELGATGLETRGSVFDEDRFEVELANELELAAHGLSFEAAPDVIALDRAGRHLRLARGAEDPFAALPAELASNARAFAATLDAHRGLLREELVAAPPELVPDGLTDALRLASRAARWRGLGAASLHELLWRLPTSIADWCGDHFDNQLFRAMLAADALPGTWHGPRAAGSSAIWLLRDAARGARARRPVGGGPALVRALLRALRERGARVHCGEALGGLLTSGRSKSSRARGAWLADGSEFRAESVLSTLAPRRTLEQLAPAGTLDADDHEALAPLRCRGTIAVLDFAFEREPAVVPLGGSDFEHLRLLHDEAQLERAADDVKHGHAAQEPWLEVHAARDGDGRAVWTTHVHGVPHAPEGGWTVPARRELIDRVYAVLGDAVPDLVDRVAAERLRTPSDLARAHGLAGGHLWHAELALDQLLMLRPTHELSSYRTPLAGLTLGSAAQHPGGLLPGRAGRTAAEILVQTS
jgi:phytoene dehydrogenase-like protein